jgi:uncharacterized protein (TIGR02145 family)
MENIAKVKGIAFLILFSNILCSCNREEIPTLTTAEISSITTTSAITGGNIVNDGGDKVSSCGVCWNTSGNPTTANSKTSDSNGKESFSSSLTQLIPNTYYTVRAYATNSAGTGYGNELSFVTLGITIDSVNDIDGNTYKTVSIGTQTWMAENLKTTKYNDNTTIPLVSDNTAWSSLISPGYCWYNNDASTHKSTYGALYNWHAVATGKLCPSGWHVPTDGQWLILSTYLGGESVAGDKMKEEGASHWKNFNNASTNVSGFTALPGGGRVNGIFVYVEESGAWWSATEYDAGNAWCRELDDNVVELLSGYLGKNQGFSVRCIKN